MMLLLAGVCGWWAALSDFRGGLGSRNCCAEGDDMRTECP